MTDVERLTRDYRTALLRFMARHDEETMTAGYELGRRSAYDQTPLLDIVTVHHHLLAEILADRPDAPMAETIESARDFLIEVLATFDMAHRGIHSAAAEPPRS